MSTDSILCITPCGLKFAHQLSPSDRTDGLKTWRKRCSSRSPTLCKEGSTGGMATGQLHRGGILLIRFVSLLPLEPYLALSNVHGVEHSAPLLLLLLLHLALALAGLHDTGCSTLALSAWSGNRTDCRGAGCGRRGTARGTWHARWTVSLTGGSWLASDGCTLAAPSGAPRSVNFTPGFPSTVPGYCDHHVQLHAGQRVPDGDADRLLRDLRWEAKKSELLSLPGAGTQRFRGCWLGIYLLVLDDIVLAAVVFLLLGRVPVVGLGVVRDQHHRLVVVAQWRWRLGPPRRTTRKLAVGGRGRVRQLVDVVRRVHGLMVLRMNLMRLHLHRAGLHAERQVGTVLVDRLLAVVAVARLHRDVVVVAMRVHSRQHIRLAGGRCRLTDHRSCGRCLLLLLLLLLVLLLLLLLRSSGDSFRLRCWIDGGIVAPGGRVLVRGDLLLGRRHVHTAGRMWSRQRVRLDWLRLGGYLWRCGGRQLGLHLLKDLVGGAKAGLDAAHRGPRVEAVIVLLIVVRASAGGGCRRGRLRAVALLEPLGACALLLHKRGQFVRFLSGRAGDHCRVDVADAVLGALRARHRAAVARMRQRVVRQVVPLSSDARRQRRQRGEELAARVDLPLLGRLVDLRVCTLNLNAHANVRTRRATAVLPRKFETSGVSRGWPLEGGRCPSLVAAYLRDDHDRVLVRLRDLLLAPVAVEQVGDLLPFEPLLELDADELGEKLLSGMYFGCCGFSSPAGLSRRSSSPSSPSQPALSLPSPPPADSSIGSSMSHVSCRMRSSSEVTSFTGIFFLREREKLTNLAATKRRTRLFSSFALNFARRLESCERDSSIQRQMDGC
uniref:Uncharacterized protein n=1 Tax=Anopheles atroparvus TaxID=41427 RepID=A0A182J4Y5_ANOAO